MINWILGVVISGALTTGVSAGMQYASTIPPMPSQTAITCHNAAWEQQTLEQYNGVKTNTALKPLLERMVTDGKKSGVSIAFNSGYRTCTEQASLRAYACGTGDYNMNIKPIKDCHPPTEPAGKSLHNEGLAVDLACNGYGVFESSPCYSWMKANHTRYFLFEHELEPWHWSTTGK
jgi:LAS superfamily LD-carboxypeptidase LdcB